MKHAAQSSQLKLTFITFFAFIAFVFQPFLQFTFVFQPFLQLLIEPLFIFALAEFPFLFKLEQQACSGSIILSALVPTVDASAAPARKPA
ncbi:MAG: hypothetical protein IJJ22_00315 [Oscillospiraceae bacterium]|nr:hypothetical protein [Oscillospiraceae bacterium]